MSDSKTKSRDSARDESTPERRYAAKGPHLHLILPPALVLGAFSSHLLGFPLEFENRVGSRFRVPLRILLQVLHPDTKSTATQDHEW